MRDKAGPAVSSTDLGGPVVPVLWKLAIGENLPPNNVIANEESTGAYRCGRSSIAKCSADDQRSRRGRRQEEVIGVRWWGPTACR